MSLFAGAIVEKRELTASAGWKKYVEGILARLTSSAGVSVTPDTAMQLGVFFDCVRVIAEDVAKLPLVLYRRVGTSGKERASDHYLYDMLHRKPNPKMTSVELRETITAHMASWGNGYLFREIENGGRVAALWPLRPDRISLRETTLDNDSTMAYYDYQLSNGQRQVFSEEQVIHLRGLSFDGREGYSITTQGKDTIGLAIAAERYGSKFFANDATPRTVLTHQKVLKEDARKNIRESWEGRFRGVDRSHLIAILEEGMDVKTIGVDPEKSLLIESREFSIEEICRWFRMPPHKVSHLKRSTFSNIEHQAIEYVVDTLLPWLVRWEQRLGVDLLTEQEQRTMFFEHEVKGLLRGDFKTRMDGYRVGREIGLYSVNDLLELENRNPIGPEGDVRHVPQNWMLLSTEQPAKLTQADKKTAGDLEQLDGRNVRSMEAQRIRDRFAPLVMSVLEPLSLRHARTMEEHNSTRIRNADLMGFREWLERFVAEYPKVVTSKVEPVLRTYASSLIALSGASGEEMEEYLTAAGERIRSKFRNTGSELLDELAREGGIDANAVVRSWLEQHKHDLEWWGELEIEEGLARLAPLSAEVANA